MAWIRLEPVVAVNALPPWAVLVFFCAFTIVLVAIAVTGSLQ